MDEVIQESFCPDLKEFYSMHQEFDKSVSEFDCQEEKDWDDIISFKELLPGKFIQKSIFFVAYIDKDDTVRINSENIMQISSYVYITTFIILYFGFCYLLSKLVNSYVKDIINPIKQITYKIHRTLKNLFLKKTLYKMQPDDIVIREPTEIREVAENFSISYKKMNTKNIFLNELELGEKVSLGKQKVIHNKVVEKMLENIKEAIDKIPDQLEIQ